MASDLHQHRLQIAFSGMKLVDWDEPPVDEVAQHRAEQFILVPIAGIERAFRYACSFGNCIHGRAIETKLHEHDTGSFDETSLPSFRLGAGGPPASTIVGWSL